MTDGVLFTEQDADEILAFIEVEEETCSGCGQPTIESLDPVNEWSYRAELYQCHACSTSSRAVDGMPPEARAGLRARVWLA